MSAAAGRRLRLGAGLLGVAAPLGLAALPLLSPGHVPSPPAHAASTRAHAPPWGAGGHRMAARAAVSALPEQIPAFFREAGEQLVYLNPEPDRWRVSEHEEMDQAFAYDHYIDLENVPQGALDAPNRFVFLSILYDAGIPQPERAVGFLPYRILEIYQRLVTEWRLWRAEDDPQRREWIAQRIVNDAGVLGHYVTDASQPHHTTIHFNGWALGAPNPERFTRDPRFHARFERYFVDAHVTDADVAQFMGSGAPTPVVGWVKEAVLAHILEAHRLVEALYRLDRDAGFEPDQPADLATVEFAASRIAAGGRMLAALWLSAWLESADEPSRGAGA